MNIFTKFKEAGMKMLKPPEVDIVPVEMFDCMHCGKCMWRDGKAQVPFACTVYTRRRELTKLKASSSNIVSVFEYPQVCSRECFDAVRMSWEWYEPTPAYDMLTVDAELIRVMWDSRDFVLPPRTP